MGQTLGNLISDAIDDMVTDEKGRGDIMEDVAEAGGISASTLGQIIAGEIDCPPIERLGGFASELEGVTRAQLVTAGNTDGCAYNADNQNAYSKGQKILSSILKKTP